MALELEIDDGIAMIRLNRPEAMNSIDPETRAELHSAWRELKENDAIRVAILTGTGEKAFCTGADLKKTMPPRESFAGLHFGHGGTDHLLHGMDTDKPIIAAVNGYALGGGLELALACDIRIASSTARFGLSEVRVGSIPGAGGTQRLPRMIGHSTAMMMLLTGEPIQADEALTCGLVSRVTEPAALMDAAREMAGKIARNAPLAVKAVKRLVRTGQDLPLQAGIEMERLAWGALRDTEDRIEGRRAFQEKRRPDYRGR